MESSLPNPSIQVEGPDDEVAMEDLLPTEFLDAQTKSFPRNALGLEDQAIDWDRYVVASAADCSSPVEAVDIGSEEVQQQVSDICDLLVDVFSDLGKYEHFLAYRGEAAQNMLDLLQM
ncbi:hypothetical protein H0H93_011033, partial [Arthromyces matolae]